MSPRREQAAAARPPAPGTAPATGTARLPLYSRLLRLRHVRPGRWQRIALGGGVVVAALLLVLADLASAWTLLVLPAAVSVVVKAHDALAGVVAGSRG